MAASGYDTTTGHPEFSDSDAPDIKLDPQQAAEYAAYVGNRICDTAADRATYLYPRQGLEWEETDTGDVYKHLGGSWRLWHRPWTDYTPTFTGFGVGTGATVVAKYSVLLGEVRFKVDVILGSSPTASGAFYVSLPLTAATSVLNVGSFITIGPASVRYMGTVGVDTSTRVWMLRADNAFISNSTYSWASGNRISLTGSYLLP